MTVEPRLRLIFVGCAVVAVIAVAGGYWRILARTRPAGKGDAATQAEAYVQSQSGRSAQLADSADKVSIRASLVRRNVGSQGRVLRVRVLIRHGWHVNANPASLLSLIPTTVKARINGKPVALRVKYPPGQDSGIRLNGKPILVYDDNTVIRAHLPQGLTVTAQSASTLKVLLTVQSCSDKGICLAPAQLSSTVALTPSGARNAGHRNNQKRSPS